MNIIAISGRKESGKDLVGSMIQYLTSDFSDKNFDNWNCKRTQEAVNFHSDWKITGFGFKVKQVASLITGISLEKFESHSFKESLLGDQWSIKESNILNNIDCFKEVNFYSLMSVRRMLERIGHGLREKLHEDVWVNALFNTLNQHNYIITDVRYPNEVQRVYQEGGVVVRLTRNSDVKSDSPPEISLDDYEFKHVIDNKDRSLSDTFYLVEDFCKQISLI